MLLGVGVALGLSGHGALAAPVPAQSGGASQGWQDLPAGHQAYARLERLIALGLVEGYDQTAFRRGLTLSRYELALAVGKAVEKLREMARSVGEEAGLGGWVRAYNERQPSSRRLSDDDVRGLTELLAFLRDELTVLGYGDQLVLSTGQVRLTNRLSLEAGLARPAWRSDGTSGELVAKVAGTWQVLPQVLQVSGEVVQDGSRAGSSTSTGTGTGDDRLYRLGARLQLGSVRLDAGVHAGRADLAPGAWAGRTAAEASNGQAVGMGVAVSLGDTVITADRGQSGAVDGSSSTVTSVGVRYVSRPLAIRAEHQAVDLDELAQGSPSGHSASRTAVGVDIAFPGGTVRFGYSVEGRATSAAGGGGSASGGVAGGSGSGSSGSADPSSGASGSTGAGSSTGSPVVAAGQGGSEQTTRTADVGITYRLSAEASLLLGYRLIDFGGNDAGSPDSRTNIATAQVSIRF